MDDPAKIIAISNGMPLVSAEVQAYYDGWEHGRKSLIKEIKAEIEQDGAYYQEIGEKERASAYLEILSTIDKCMAKAESGVSE